METRETHKTKKKKKNNIEKNKKKKHENNKNKTTTKIPRNIPAHGGSIVNLEGLGQCS